jgi:DNA-binding transcriptional ArsR family regulator
MVQFINLDTTFAALSDPTRRGILERLARGPATISDLAEAFAMTLTGIKKHVGLLEAADMVVTDKRGRVRYCQLGPNALDAELAWIHSYRAVVESRLDHLEEFLQRTEKDR